ncbi:adenosylcobinamide-GDP ribazoletransferase [Zavarzinia sp.]|uniref:adenosylcobinamide-GDP ribazoletransferase n=1 Tax=Zavarzinia sp. TaxID=2027920 RepID=UPI003567C457
MQDPLPTRPLDDFRLVLGLFSRLPVGTLPAMAPGALGRAVWAFPLAGATVGLVAVAVAAVGTLFGFGPYGLALLVILAEVATTGGFHEDGLADLADGLGGRDRETRLAIMRDSRIGSFGAIALWASLTARLFALASLAEAGFWTLAGAVIAADAAARVALLIPLALLEPARKDGLGASLGPLSADRGWSAVVIALGIGIVGLGFGVIAATAAAAAAGLAVAAVAREKLGGYTGDVLGAAASIALVAVLAAAAGHV